MDIKVYMDFHLVPAKEALIRYKANPDEVANRGDSEDINLIFGDGFIYQDEEGSHDISIPTCERPVLVTPTRAAIGRPLENIAAQKNTAHQQNAQSKAAKQVISQASAAFKQGNHLQTALSG